MFYNYKLALSTSPSNRKKAGSHSDVPLVTITDANDKQIYSDFPDAGLERGEMTEVTLITLDKCGYPVKSA